MQSLRVVTIQYTFIWVSKINILNWKQQHIIIQIHNTMTTVIALSFYGHFDNDFLVNRLSRAPNRWHEFVDNYLKNKKKKQKWQYVKS